MAGTKEGAAKRRAAREALEAAPPVSSAPKRYIVARRPIKDGVRTYKPGDVFPKAHELPRLDTWLRTGMLIEA